jgi:hypothetical protein
VIFQWSYSGATVMLQCGTVVLQWGHSSVTVVLPVRWRLPHGTVRPARRLHPLWPSASVREAHGPPRPVCCKSVARALQECCRSVAEVLQECCKSFAGMECRKSVVKKIPRVLRGSTKSVSRVLQKCRQSVARVSPECRQSVARVFKEYSLSVTGVLQ